MFCRLENNGTKTGSSFLRSVKNAGNESTAMFAVVVVGVFSVRRWTMNETRVSSCSFSEMMRNKFISPRFV